MADYTTKRIDAIHAGEMVLSISEREDPNALGELPQLRASEVQAVFAFAVNEILHIYLDGEEIKTTPTHPFYAVGRGWVRADQLNISDALVTADGEVVPISALQVVADPEIVYNLSLTENFTFFPNGILAHNMSFGFYAFDSMANGKNGEVFEILDGGMFEHQGSYS